MIPMHPTLALDVLPAVTQSTFFMVFMAMAAAALFITLERTNVPERFRPVMGVSVVILAIAATNYFYMFNVYREGLSRGDGHFPTVFRYIDWLLTTPLLLMEFPLLLGVGARGVAFMRRLILLDLVMIAAGYFGEVYPANPALHWGLFLVGCIAWLAILVQMFTALQTLPPSAGPSLRGALRLLGMFFLVGWAIYPLGYFAPILELPLEVRELVYNLADVVNKVGPALVIYAAARGTLREEQESAAYLAPEEPVVYGQA